MEENKELIEITPDKDVSNANMAANKLKILMDAKPKKVIINGKRYLEFDDWQTIAAFFRCTIKTEEALPVEIGGIAGFKAKAVVLDKDGKVIGGAEAYCMRDEPNWNTRPTFVENKKVDLPVPLFQLASMAATRAGSKALSNIFRWVVVMGGFAGTPAEEMTGNEKPFSDHKIIEKKCKECGAVLSDKVFKYSIDTYHTPLCYAHQQELKKKIEEGKAEEEVVM